jgi:predicted nucleotide-binding protein
MKESVARFLEKLDLRPIILHEQPNKGRTVIEKFEAHSDVGFAVVLLTPDDVGGLASSPDKLSRRARQNVILELGYFIGKLGRAKVCALYKEGVEIPSDIHFMWNNRQLNDGERTIAGIKAAEGKRLMYRPPVLN